MHAEHHSFICTATVGNCCLHDTNNIITTETYLMQPEVIGGYYESCPPEEQLDLSRQNILVKVKQLLSGKFNTIKCKGWNAVLAI